MGKTSKVLATVAAGAMAAAAGYFFYASKNAKKNRKVVAKWANDFKDDVAEQTEQIKTINKDSLATVVDGVTKAYESVRSVDRGDLLRAADELKRNWKLLRDEVLSDRGGAKTTTRSKTRGAAKKSAKSRSRKS